MRGQFVVDRVPLGNQQLQIPLKLVNQRFGFNGMDETHFAFRNRAKRPVGFITPIAETFKDADTGQEFQRQAGRIGRGVNRFGDFPG
jgi:hypothetical protein